MAARSAKGVGLVLLMVVSAWALALPTAEAMRVDLLNLMTQDVSVACTGGGSTGVVQGVLTSGKAFPIELGSNFEGVKYTCGFMTTGKTRAIVQVFLGTGGLTNEPCHCVGSLCVWTISTIGFACTEDYRHGWN